MLCKIWVRENSSSYVLKFNHHSVSPFYVVTIRKFYFFELELSYCYFCKPFRLWSDGSFGPALQWPPPATEKPFKWPPLPADSQVLWGRLSQADACKKGTLLEEEFWGHRSGRLYGPVHAEKGCAPLKCLCAVGMATSGLGLCLTLRVWLLSSAPFPREPLHAVTGAPWRHLCDCSLRNIRLTWGTHI